jgi:soluble lytic murein transglycosylase-like protein
MAAANVHARRVSRTYWLTVCAVLLFTAATLAQAQSCAGQAARSVTGTGKFRLIAQQCAVLDEPLEVQHAAQLDVYQRAGASVGISISAPGTLPAEPAASAAVPNRLPLPSKAPPTRAEQRVIALAPALTEAARAHQLDPLLLHAIAHVESRHDTQAISRAGARGAMQMMPATARRFGVADPERGLHDADTNLRAAASYLRTLHARFRGDLRLVLAAYNAGEGAVERYGRSVPPYAETQAYVRDVLAIHRRLSQEFEVSADGRVVARGA